MGAIGGSRFLEGTFWENEEEKEEGVHGMHGA